MHPVLAVLDFYSFWSAVLQISLPTTGLTVFLVWLLRRFERPTDAYMEEFAKAIARHQNLDRLVDETRHLTETAEGIKAELNLNLWGEQQRWTQRLDAYLDFTRSANSFVLSFLRWYAVADSYYNSHSDSEEERERIKATMLEVGNKRLEEMERVHPSTALVQLAGAEEPAKIAGQFLLLIVDLDYPVPRPKMERMRKLVDSFITAARSDLGYRN